MNVFKFLLVSCLGRGGRFFLVSAILMLFGETIRQYLNYVIAGVSVLLVAFFVILYKKRHSILKKEDVNVSIIKSKPHKESENMEQEICR